MEQIFYTKPFGHIISQIYTMALYAAIGYIFVPDLYFIGSEKYVWAIGIPVMAVFLTYFLKIFSRSGVARVKINPEGIFAGFYRVGPVDIIRIVKVNRPGLFGPELQLWTDTIRPAASIVLRELQQPDACIDAIKNAAPNAAYKESYASFNFLDWGLIIIFAVLAWLIAWKVFL